jgi:quinol monooxygenase YgiN
MAIKVLIQRRIKPGKEGELNQLVRELRTKAMHAQGFISGETLQSLEDPTVHLTISTWKNIADWKRWMESPARKESQEKVDSILTDPTVITPYQYE